jgi:hypothetical protein
VLVFKITEAEKSNIHNEYVYRGKSYFVFFLKNQTIDFCNISHKIPEILIIIIIKVSLIRHSWEIMTVPLLQNNRVHVQVIQSYNTQRRLDSNKKMHGYGVNVHWTIIHILLVINGIFFIFVHFYVFFSVFSFTCIIFELPYIQCKVFFYRPLMSHDLCKVASKLHKILFVQIIIW